MTFELERLRYPLLSDSCVCVCVCVCYVHVCVCVCDTCVCVCVRVYVTCVCASSALECKFKYKHNLYLMYCCKAGFLLESTLTSAAIFPDLHLLRVRMLLATSLIFSKLTRPSINVSLPMLRKYASLVTRGMKGIIGGDNFDWYARSTLWLRVGSW